MGALQILITWLLPSNTGDLTPSVGIDAYTLDILASPGEAPLLITFPTEARTLTASASLGKIKSFRSRKSFISSPLWTP